MAPLGLNLTTIGAIGGNFISPEATVIEDYVFEISGGELQPRDVTHDFSDTWDVTATEISPAASPVEEGYFDIDGNGDIQPKA